MSFAFAALRALPVTFALYVLEALIALTLTVPLSSELSYDARALGARSLFRAAALEHALALLPALRVEARAIALSALILVAFGPLLHMGWLSALAAPLGPWRAFGAGARLYPRACATSLAVVALLALALSPWALFAYLAHRLVDPAEHARLHDLLLLGCAASALPVVFLAHVAHDLARAAALRHGALNAARRGLRAALSLRTLLIALALFALGLLLGSPPFWLSTGTNRLGELGAAIVYQAAALASLGARSVWLAFALACVQPALTSGEARD